MMRPMNLSRLWLMAPVLLSLAFGPRSKELPNPRTRGADVQEPPAESRIIKIIHSWPDEPTQQDNLIVTLRRQGFGGVVCNVSFNEYLQSENRWKTLSRAVEEARKAGFSLWLYDEKGYPSGSAGGQVLRGHPEWEARGLLIADARSEGGEVGLELPPGELKLAAAYRVGAGKIDPTIKTNLAEHVTGDRLHWIPPAGTWQVLLVTESHLFEGTHAAMNLADHIPYPNLLEPAPTARFLELTHDAYAAHVGNDLGRYFVSTFTDEPSLMSLFLRPMPYRVLPWCTNFASIFRAKHNYDIEDKLAALMLDEWPESLKTRYDYWQTVAAMVSENYFGQIERWCAAHHVLSGGHLLMEENLVAQVPLYGDFFSCLRQLDAPGIDCLTSIPGQVPWSIARLAGSVAELQGGRLTMCETSDHSQRYRPAGDSRSVERVTPAQIRGTCNRLILNGINTITSYYSFDGLNDEQLVQLNRYVGRCCAAVKDGYQVADIAVAYPTESLWVRFRPGRSSVTDSPSAARIENTFHDVSDALYEAGRDFCYIDSRALMESRSEKGVLVHGDSRWRVVILPAIDTLPRSAWQILVEFVKEGGALIAVGALPANSEQAFPDSAVSNLSEQTFGALQIGSGCCRTNSQGGVAIALPAGRAGQVSRIVAQIVQPDFNAKPAGPLRCTHRRVRDKEVFFFINDSAQPWEGALQVLGDGPGTSQDPETGKITESAGDTPLRIELPPYGSRVMTFAHSKQPARLSLNPHGGRPILNSIPFVKPLISHGEFVREQLEEMTARSGSGNSNAEPPVTWRVTGNLTKGQVDTFLFARFEYPQGLPLKPGTDVVIDSWVPEEQRTGAQLLVMLHEKGGADYLAGTGRLLSGPAHEQSWIPLSRFQLAGWSKDANGRLDLDEVTELRIGWGGYYGSVGERVEFSVATPQLATPAPEVPLP